MTHRINRAAAVAAIIAALGASQVASATAYLTPYTAEVFSVAAPNPTARAFNGVYVVDTFEASSKPVHEQVLRDLDELLFDTTVVGIDAAALQLSFVQGVTGVLNTVTVTGGTLAVTQPGFDIAYNGAYQGGKPPSATTDVPEPATGLLLLIGASALVAARRRPR